MCALHPAGEILTPLKRHGVERGLEWRGGGDQAPGTLLPRPGDSPASSPFEDFATEEHTGSINLCQAGTRWYPGRTG